jgi:NADH-quinone oxidoreductase subunit J
VNQFLFYLLSLLAVIGGIMVVTRKSPVDSVLFLLLTMLALAGHYAMLDAPFLAVVQVIVYAGAVVVLFLFVIMMLNLKRDRLLSRTQKRNRALYAFCGVALMLVMTGFFRESPNWLPPATERVSGTIEAVGLDLFQRWVYPFELTSVLLLAAMVGAVALTRKAQTDDVEPSGDGEDAS